MNNLLLHMGPKVSKLLETLQKKETDFTSYENLKEFFDKQFIGTKNTVYARAKFNLRAQKEGEKAQEYISELISLAKSCDFKSLENELVRDRLVVGIQDEKLSEVLQMDSALTLEKAIEKITQSERIREENREIRGKTENVSRVMGKGFKKKEKVYGNKNKSTTNQTRCTRCGETPGHQKFKCQAKNVRCKKCKIVGHFALQCRTKNFSEIVDEESTSTSNESEAENVSEIININRVSANEPWKIKFKVNDTKIKFKIDTGADETIISEKDFHKKLEKFYKLKNTDIKLVGPGTGTNSQLKVFGQIKIPVNLNGNVKKIKCFVVDTKENLLGRPALTKLNLVTWKDEKLNCTKINEISNRKSTQNSKEEDDKKFKKQITDEYPKLCEGIGHLKDFEHKICLTENAIPYAISSPRRVALPLHEQVEKEILRMQNEGVIEKIEEPTEWCAPMVVTVKKDNGGVRVCGDYTQLNKWIIRERYQLPSVEETLAKLKDAQVFTKLDLASGFWQLGLKKNSRKLTTFITPVTGCGMFGQ